MFKLLREMHSLMLCEMPYIIDGDHYHTIGYQDVFMSTKAITRTFKPLNLKIAGAMFFRHVEINQVIGVIPEKKITGEDSNKIIFELSFKREITLKKRPQELGTSVIQVSSAFTDKAYRNRAIAAQAYRALIDEGFVVLSDCDQFIPGKNLWERLSKDAKHYGLQVNIINIHGEFMRDDSLAIVDFDGTNIPEDDIWSNNIHESRDQILLVLRKR